MRKTKKTCPRGPVHLWTNLDDVDVGRLAEGKRITDCDDRTVGGSGRSMESVVSIATNKELVDQLAR